MRKTFLTLMFLVVAVLTANAQTTFNEAVKAYIRSCPAATSSMTNSMKEALSTINSKIVEDFNGQDSEALMSKYMKTKYLDDAAEYLMAPVMEGHVTIAELNELTNAMLSPQGKQFQAHLLKTNAKASPEMVKFGKKLAQAIIDGKTPAPIPLRSDCPKSYVDLYNKFYSLAKLDQSIDAIMTSLKQTSGLDNDDLFKKLAQYLHDNMKTAYINFSYGMMSIDDLKFGIKTYGSTAYQHCVESLKNLSQVAQTGAMKLVMNYIEWLKNQGVKIKE